MNRKQRRLQEKAAKKNAQGKMSPGLSIQQQLQMAAGFFQENRFAEAGRCLQGILKKIPAQPDALHLSGLIHLKSGDFAKAGTCFEKICTDDPGNIHVLNLLGVSLNKQGQFTKAVPVFEKLLSLNPRHIDGHFNLGNAFKELGQFDQACKHYRQAVEFEPRFADALFNLGLVYKALERPHDAIECYRKCLALEPGNPEVLTSLGNAEMAANRPGDAIKSHNKALEAAPEYVEAWNNLGSVLTHQRQYDDGEKAINRALQLAPKDTRLMDNLGICQHKSGKLEDAIATFRRALEIDPDNAKIHFDLGLSLLHAGRLLEGWPEWEWRWQVDGLGLAENDYPMPRWNGEKTGGKSILVHSEQGFGDTFQFIRLTRALKQMGFQIIVRCHAAIIPVLKTMDAIEQVITDNDPVPDTDFHVPLMSLPLLLNVSENNIPADIPYLYAPAETAERWQSRLAGDKNRKVGLVWSGNPDQENDHNRSMPVDFLRPLLETEGVSFYSLQVGARGQDLAPEISQKFTDLSGDLTDFGETAGVLSALDLLISVDTGPLHLAGAMGIEAWGMLARVPDWRYLMEGERIDWYPSLKFFRQPDHGDWESVIHQVKTALGDLPEN